MVEINSVKKLYELLKGRFDDLGNSKDVRLKNELLLNLLSEKLEKPKEMVSSILNDWGLNYIRHEIQKNLGINMGVCKHYSIDIDSKSEFVPIDESCDAIQGGNFGCGYYGGLGKFLCNDFE